MKKFYANNLLTRLFSKYWKLFVWVLCIFSIYHTIRDILQIQHIDNIISMSFHTSRTWCNPICDYITFPPELYIIIISPILLYRKKFGKLGASMIICFSIWAIAFWYSVFTRPQ